MNLTKFLDTSILLENPAKPSPEFDAKIGAHLKFCYGLAGDEPGVQSSACGLKGGIRPKADVASLKRISMKLGSKNGIF